MNSFEEHSGKSCSWCLLRLKFVKDSLLNNSLYSISEDCEEHPHFKVVLVGGLSKEIGGTPESGLMVQWR